MSLRGNLIETRGMLTSSSNANQRSLLTASGKTLVGDQIWSRWVLTISVGLTVFPALLDLWIGGARRAIGYFAADAFYYLTVARNLLDYGTTTFDQVTITNGYHPLWQFALALMMWVWRAAALSEPTQLVLTAAAGVCLNGAAVYLLGRAIWKARGRLSTAFLLIAVGPYAIFLSGFYWGLSPEQLALQNPYEGIMPVYGTLWSFANGMESSLALFFFAALAYVYVAYPVLSSPRAAAGYGALCSLLVLARLDHALLVVPLLAVYGLRALLLRTRESVHCALAAWFAFGAPVAIYLLLNWLWVGAAVPTSGSMKSSFPRPGKSGVDGLARIPIAMETGRRYLGLLYREAQIVIPCVVALLLIPWLLYHRLSGAASQLSRRRPADRWDSFLLQVGFGVLILGAYNWFFVLIVHQGHWYFPVSCVFVSLALFRLLSLPRFVASWELPARWAGAVAITAFCVFFFLTFHRKPAYHENYADFCLQEAPRLKEAYRGKEPKLLSLDDGVIAYCTGFPSMSGMGLALDPPAARAYKQGKLGPLAVARGYDRIASLVYANPAHLKPSTPKKAVNDWAHKRYKRLFGANPEFDFEVEYRSPESGFVVLVARPR